MTSSLAVVPGISKSSNDSEHLEDVKLRENTGSSLHTSSPDLQLSIRLSGSSSDKPSDTGGQVNMDQTVKLKCGCCDYRCFLPERLKKHWRKYHRPSSGDHEHIDSQSSQKSTKKHADGIIVDDNPGSTESFKSSSCLSINNKDHTMDYEEEEHRTQPGLASVEFESPSQTSDCNRINMPSSVLPYHSYTAKQTTERNNETLNGNLGSGETQSVNTSGAVAPAVIRTPELVSSTTQTPPKQSTVWNAMVSNGKSSNGPKEQASNSKQGEQLPHSEQYTDHEQGKFLGHPSWAGTNETDIGSGTQASKKEADQKGVSDVIQGDEKHFSSVTSILTTPSDDFSQESAPDEPSIQDLEHSVEEALNIGHLDEEIVSAIEESLHDDYEKYNSTSEDLDTFIEDGIHVPDCRAGFIQFDQEEWKIFEPNGTLRLLLSGLYVDEKHYVRFGNFVFVCNDFLQFSPNFTVSLSSALPQGYTPQEILTLALSSLSVVSMLVFIATAVVKKMYKKIPDILKLNLTCSLLLAQTLFVFSDEIPLGGFCVFLAILTHYMFLVAFLTMNVLAFDLFRTLGGVSVSTGFSIILEFSRESKFVGYGTDICWIKHPLALVVSNDAVTFVIHLEHMLVLRFQCHVSRPNADVVLPEAGELYRLWRDHVGIRPRYAGRGASASRASFIASGGTTSAFGRDRRGASASRSLTSDINNTPPCVLSSNSNKCSSSVLCSDTVSQVCVARGPDVRNVTFVAPVGLVLASNVYFFIHTVLNITVSSIRTARARHGATYSQLQAFLKISTLMGLGWIIGFVAAGTQQDALWYIFITLNSSQGFLISISFMATPQDKANNNKRKGRASMVGGKNRSPFPGGTHQNRLQVCRANHSISTASNVTDVSSASMSMSIERKDDSKDTTTVTAEVIAVELKDLSCSVPSQDNNVHIHSSKTNLITLESSS
ncbi:hypothetical protein Bbelb_362630 [Branchiostoma belcheri]|nr:hypothetical protein Bbelb_362630 [Branchiostoma belcheri]